MIVSPPAVDKVPPRVIDGNVDMAEARRKLPSPFAEPWHHAQVEDAALRQRFGKRWIDNKLSRCFIFDGDQPVRGHEWPWRMEPCSLQSSETKIRLSPLPGSSTSFVDLDQ
jgi:hypothetical protein